MKGLFTVLLITSSIIFSSACTQSEAVNAEVSSSNALENVNLSADTNTNPPEISSEPVPVFDNADTALAEGNKYFDANETDKSIEAYTQAINLNPDLAEAHFRLGIAYLLKERETEADKLPGEETEPTPGKGKNKKKEPEKTPAEKEFEKAAELYEKAVKKDEKDDISFFNLGRSYSKLNEDDKAAKAFTQAAKLNPENSEYQTQLAESLINIAEYDRAVVALKKALELDENNLEAEDLMERAKSGQRRLEFGKKQLQEKFEQQYRQEEEQAVEKISRRKPSASAPKSPAPEKPAAPPQPSGTPGN